MISEVTPLIPYILAQFAMTPSSPVVSVWGVDQWSHIAYLAVRLLILALLSTQ